MIPRLLKAGFFWRSNDPADIIVGESSINDVVCIAPTLYPVFKYGNKSGIGQVMIRLSELTFLAAGLFGPDRQSPLMGGSKWNGSAYRYGVYVYHNTLRGTRSIVIFRNSPSGAAAVMLPEHSTESWESFFYGIKADVAWDLCHSIMGLREATIIEIAHNAAAKKEDTDAANHKADALQHGANTNPATGPQNLQGLHKKAAVRKRGVGVEGSGSPLVEGQGHQPGAALTAV